MATEVKVPDIGGATDVEVIEVQVKAGDKIAADDSLITLESEKAAMDVPAPSAGVVKEVKVKVGDKVSEGSLIVIMESADTKPEEKSEEKPKKEAEQQSEEKSEEKPAEQPKEKPKQAAEPAPKAESVSKAAPAANVYAGPAVRRLAYELDLDLNQVTGTGDKNRITKDDLNNFIKNRMQGGGAGGGVLPSAPNVDFSKFGEVETQALTKINKLTGKNMQRNWLLVPHVTQFDEADITAMEEFRQQNKADAEKQGFKLTPLVFVMKAAVAALKAFPRFNASLDPSGEHLVMKKYFHIGVAVDTPNGLVVPVIRDVDQKGLFDLAKELGEVSIKARDGKLMPKDMQGGCFTISSLGGIGGTAFTPIVNVPEVAILGVSRSQMKPVYNGKTFEPRLMLPLSLSYDHRVIDGAAGARFAVYLSQCLTDLRKLLL
ncbi:MAG: dihydrolipoyllysine-residue acetyltransferase [Legionellaceae bacterium]|nr:dihydrolipoyllysine-residue acetyltransferase [Legionellaceae bacterium]|tara:strand:- start:483 stop:1775 length:1293 start_codon:yes stop_codon:yes gene_type:complete